MEARAGWLAVLILVTLSLSGCGSGDAGCGTGTPSALDAVTEEGNRRRARGQCATMCSRIDALRKSAHDAESRRAEMPAKLEGIATARPRRVTTTDDRQRRQVQCVYVTVDEQFRGGTGNPCQQ